MSYIIASKTVKAISFSCLGFEGSIVEFVGQADLLEPRQMPSHSQAANALLSGSPAEAKPCVTVLYTPTDTDVRREFETEFKDVDLLMDTSQCVPGFVKLVPVMTELWPCEQDERGRKMYLPHLKMTQTVGSLYNTEGTKVFAITKMCISFRAHWPDEAKEWIVRTRPHNWPSQKVRKVIIQNGCRIIPHDSHTSRQMWKIDFGVSEEILLRQAVSSYQQMGDNFTLKSTWTFNDVEPKF
ncbi:hypothetical protein ACJMK2_024796 [Sinanodonta woodiana]|uniref:Mab-21-like nucleotidyltransferase domain-containing protein n=1 Tax=Sinanodonta woodiana TaxID=1069815 RepID=A0ABD3XEH8_SINWO